jgi:hypothetical protein
VAYSHGNEDYDALGCKDGKVYLHRLDNGKRVGELHEKGSEHERSMEVSEAPTIMQSPDGSNGADSTWLVMGDKEGVVRI